jgi:hypothetical protein
VVSILIYAFTRVYRLADYPIYFFSDEAVNTVLAADLVRNGLRDHLGTFLPTYFENTFYYSLSSTVYLQVIPTLLFGPSVEVTRAVPALATLFGAIAVALIARRAFRIRLWWSAVLLLGLAPAWFLHSRTAFETCLMVSFYAWFVYFYLVYRDRRPRAVYPAIAFAALTFYAYRGGQLILLATCLLLFISDLRYHLSHRKTLARGALLAAALALPYLRFQFQHPGETLFHLQLVGSYLTVEGTLASKARTFIDLFTRALDPAYWFLPHLDDLPRHLMDGNPHLPTWTAPLAAAGLIACFRRLGQAPSRALLLILIATPLGGVLIGMGITRVMAAVVPLTLLSLLGLAAVAEWLRPRFGELALSLALFAFLATSQLALLRSALREGPTWYTDYGLGGMQYGASQVFAAIQGHLDAHPSDQVVLSPTWANGTDTLLRFFLHDDPRVRLGSIATYTDRYQTLTEDMLFVFPDDEYAAVRAEPKIEAVRLVATLPYPDGTPGFRFFRMRYSEQAETLFAAEEAQRHRPVIEWTEIGGERIRVEHSAFDMGGVEHVFDGETFTMARTDDLNPLRLALEFPSPRRVRALSVTTGSMDIELTVRLIDEAGATVAYVASFTDLPDDPTVRLDFGRGPDRVIRMEIEIRDIRRDEEAKIHLREVVIE